MPHMGGYMDYSRKPHPKVAASSAAGAATILLVFILDSYGVHIPPGVAAAITVLLSSAAGYMKASS